MKVAVIPARGGSKRIPRKNIKQFCGKPMIAWSIEAALTSGCFDRVIVSTEDAEIAEVARNRGAEVPFVRPMTLADDHTGTLAVIHHAIEALEADGHRPDFICCIYATAPFVTAEDLQKGYSALEAAGEAEADYAMSVTRYRFPIQRAVRITSAGRIQMMNPENFNVRSQDLEEAWHDAGQFYWGRYEAWIQERMLFAERTIPVELPTYRVQDIDTVEDWHRAELLFKTFQR